MSIEDKEDNLEEKWQTLTKSCSTSVNFIFPISPHVCDIFFLTKDKVNIKIQRNNN